MYPTKLLRELRLMRDQPDHRFYTACIVAVALVAIPTLAYLLK